MQCVLGWSMILVLDPKTCITRVFLTRTLWETPIDWPNKEAFLETLSIIFCTCRPSFWALVLVICSGLLVSTTLQIRQVEEYSTRHADVMMHRQSSEPNLSEPVDDRLWEKAPHIPWLYEPLKVRSTLWCWIGIGFQFSQDENDLQTYCVAMQIHFNNNNKSYTTMITEI